MTAGCDICTLAKAQPELKRYRPACTACAIRRLAMSPHFCAGSLDNLAAAPFRRELGQVAGDRWRDLHPQVVAERKRIREAGAIL